MPDVLLPPAPELPGATHVHSGKVRDLYELTEGPHAGRLVMVASDRISAFDYVLGSVAFDAAAGPPGGPGSDDVFAFGLRTFLDGLGRG